MRKTSILTAAFVASLVLVLLAGSAAAQDVSVSAEAQATAGDNVTIDSVEIDNDGWVAVYEESVTQEPNFDGMIGVAEVEEGSHSDVVVETPDLEEDGFYYAVLHYDESASSEFDYPTDPVVTDQNDTNVQDYFFVAVGTRDVHQSYAEANQNKRELEDRLSSLRDRVDELEGRGNESLQSELEDLRNEIDRVEEDIETLDDTISETERLLQQLEETEQQMDGEDDGGMDNETDDDMDGNESEDGGTEDDQPEGLPGFTAVAALIAALTVALLARRNR